MAPETALDTAFRFVECINRRDLDGLTALISGDHVFIDLGGEEHRGKNSMIEGWRSYFTQFPEYMIHLAEAFILNETVVLVGRTTGSHTGQPRAEEFRGTVIWVAETHQGQVQTWQILDDTPENRAELGLKASQRIA